MGEGISPSGWEGPTVKVEGTGQAVRREFPGKVARIKPPRFVSPRGGKAEEPAFSDEPHMVGNCDAMRRVFEIIRRMGPTDAPVLITGESGTGKELAALAVHERSSYAKGPFVAVNCAGLPRELIASELFGHEKGSFTGAHQRKIGRVEAAQHGTLFLDEIGDLPLELQGHLLRFLQEKTIERVGGHGAITVDTRVLAATHRDLRKEVREGRFREDLYYRLAVLSLEMPPLRERGEDIEIMSTYFLRKFKAEMGREFCGFDRQALAALRAHSWPGNVRELISCIRRAAVMAMGEWISPQDLGLARGEEIGLAPAGGEGGPSQGVERLFTGADGQILPLKEALDRFESMFLEHVLELHGHNVTRASELLGVSRVTLYRLMDKHGLRPERGDSGAN